ncbi:GNAT family N-acetyltransferase [Amnibacterium sp. CER49]|uniref:GNAT family N-acetyltransferase n=1 Tax=Amnibacterium sp. CER49 TaxID=3039161 RepID=UPI00244AD1C0|nr:GNAT family N-acetyltransferase [Amnibacterium sp. CER49]MDH2442389.1 GNAT family N-acetyltransferase [Amnibacterium sp. CER49]
MDIEHEADRSRYVGRIDGQVVTVLDYADNGSVVSMTRTFTNPPFRGNGYAALIVAHAVDAVEAKGKRIRPMCWYVADWFEAHPERAALLA